MNFYIRLYNIFIDCLNIGECFFKLLQTRLFVIDKEGVIRLKVTARRVEFTNILFFYADGDWLVVNKISFIIEGGKTVVLIR